MEDSEPRPLRLADAAAGSALSAEANWNQTEDDWRFLLQHGWGIGIETAGRLVATTIVVDYAPRISWISMVLVTPSQRKRGLATRLLDAAIAQIRARGTVAGLDATPAGREVYRRLGFVDGAGLLRFEAPLTFPEPTMAGIEPLDLQEIFELDRTAFGGERGAVLRELARRAPGLALGYRREGRLVGFALGRDGRGAHQIGPIVAEDSAIALALLEAARARAPGPVLADIFAVHGSFVAAVRARGWTEQRPYTRMSIGVLPQGRPELVFAAAGPELA
jgi:GNAT superfamily N-acetyltransferase